VDRAQQSAEGDRDHDEHGRERHDRQHEQGQCQGHDRKKTPADADQQQGMQWVTETRHGCSFFHDDPPDFRYRLSIDSLLPID